MMGMVLEGGVADGVEICTVEIIEESGWKVDGDLDTGCKILDCPQQFMFVVFVLAFFGYRVTADLDSWNCTVMSRGNSIRGGTERARRLEEQFQQGLRLPRYWTQDGFPIVGGVVMQGPGYNSTWVPELKVTEERGWKESDGWYLGGRITDPGNFQRTFGLTDKQVMGYMVTSYLH